MKHPKLTRLLSALLALTLLLAVAPQLTLPARAATYGSCGDALSWSFDPNYGVLTITGFGDMYDFADYDDYDEDGNYLGHVCDIPWQDYFWQIRSVSLPVGLTCIGDNAFYNCGNLMSVSIPEGVTEIGWYAFRCCSNLQSVVIPDSVTSLGYAAFAECVNLQSIRIPDSVTVIEGAAFWGCECLPGVDIPSGVEEIGNVAFAYCTSLGTISLPDSLERLGGDAFYGTAYYNNVNRWANGLLYLGKWVIAADPEITSANIWPGVLHIAANLFAGNSSLRSVTIPDGVETIGEYAFYDCEALSSVTLPSSVRSIGAGAFNYTQYYNNWNNWENRLLYLGSWLIAADREATWAAVRPGTRGIAADVFYGCEGLSSVTLPEGLRYIGEYAFCGCWNLPQLTLPDTLESIGPNAFVWCSGLKSLTLPGSLTSIPESAFYGCASLTELKLPDSIASIGSWAFALCESLRTVIVPAGVKRIGFNAFAGCGNLNGVLIQNRDCEIYGDYGTLGDSYRTTIFGYPGSTAESYAWRYGYAFKSVAAGSFIDVSDYAYYAGPVAWALESGITTGTAPFFFSPDSTCTRAQIVTFLWRAAGSPEPTSNVNPFTDVAEGQYYYKAVLWAVGQGITNGTSADRFSPNSGCTRGQVVTFLWRALGRPAPASAGNPFADVDLNEYYGQAVLWAVENGVTKGTSANRFSPNSTCTRAQIVTFLYRTYVEPAEPGSGNLVGVAMPTRDLQRWNQDGNFMRMELETAGYDVDLQFASNDPWIQISQIENMIANGARVLIIAAIDGDAMGTVLEQAREAGCTVIAYDRPIFHRAINYYVTYDNFSIGAAQGQFIVDQLELNNAGGRTYNLELACGSPDDGNAYVFYDGAMSVLRPYIAAGTLKVVSGQVEFEQVATQGWSSERAQQRFENILSTYYQGRPLDAVMCSNDSTAQGVVTALQNAYRNDVYPIITGQDCDIVSIKNIVDDWQAMSIFKDTRTLCARTVGMADAIMHGQTPATNAEYTTIDGMYTYPAFFCEPIACTKDMIQSLLIDTGYYTYQEIYG